MKEKKEMKEGWKVKMTSGVSTAHYYENGKTVCGLPYDEKKKKKYVAIDFAYWEQHVRSKICKACLGKRFAGFRLGKIHADLKTHGAKIGR